MRHISLFSGIAGFEIAFKNVFGEETYAHSEIDENACKIYHRHFKESRCLGNVKNISLRRDFPVKTQVSQEHAKVLRENEQDSSQSWQELLMNLNRNGLSLRMFPDSFLPTKERISGQSLPRLSNSGIAWRGQYLTLNTSESLNREDVCGLSEVLETQVPPKYYLSRRAVEGMVKRSKKWGRGGYVFLQEMVNETTQRMKHLSLSQLEQLTSREQRAHEVETLSQELLQEQRTTGLQLSEGQTLLPQLSEQTTTIPQEIQSQTTSLLTPSTQEKEVSLDEYGKTLILRKLMPIEKERLMGFPEGWTDGLSDAKRGHGLGNAIVPKVAQVIMEAIKRHQ